MKTLKLIPFLTLLFILLSVGSCSDDDPAPVKIASISGVVTYPNTNGSAVAAPGAIITLTEATLNVNMSTISDEDGNYSFDNLLAGTYTLDGFYDTDNTNAAGRFRGLRFVMTPVEVEMTGEAVTQNLALASGGQTNSTSIVAAYQWDGSAYAQPAAPAWQFDNNHSLVTFEFPYRGENADFTGSFKQMHKFVVNFNPTNLAASTINAEIDLSSVDTRTPGGRDNRTTVADNPEFTPTTMFTELGCISGTFGITPDNAAPTEAEPQMISDTKRWAKFTSTSISTYGDGYLAKGNLIFFGKSVPVTLMFKTTPPHVISNSNGTTTTRTGFEGRMVILPKADFGLDSGNINDAPVTIIISIVGSVTQ